MTRIWWILIRALEGLNNLHFNWPLSCKVYNAWSKEAQRSYYTEEPCNIWGEPGLWFGKWHEELGKFSPEHLESVKIGTLMRSVCPKKTVLELKIYRGIMCNDTEEWWKILREIDLPFQNWRKGFDESWLDHSKVSKIYALLGCFWRKYIIFELKK